MTGCRTIIGICALSALVFAIVAQSASGLGTTGYTCKHVAKAEGTAGFTGPHCRSEDAVATNAEYEHVSIAANNSTEVSTIITNAKLRSTIAGSAIEIVGTAVGSGSFANSEAGGEMVASGEGKLVFTGVTENLLGCKVTGKPGGAGVVETTQLVGTTAGQGDKVKFFPKEGTLLAEFELTGCVVGPLAIKLVGTVVGLPNGATINFSHGVVTGEKTFRLQSAAGPVAGLEGSFTLGSFTPISPTT